MKRQMTLLATVLVSALPIAAQASVASRQAIDVNHESLNQSTEVRHVEENGHDAGSDAYHYPETGKSAAMIDTRQKIASLTEHRTNLPNDDDESQVGHATDW